MNRFFISNLPDYGSVSLSKEDARHATTVLRLSKGDSVHLFDGKAKEAIGRIEHAVKGRVEIEIVQCLSLPPASSHRLDILVALPKGDRQRVLVDMLVQLGVHSLTPLHCTRSVAQPTDQAIIRLQRAVIESCKQCERNLLLKVLPPANLQDINRLAISLDCEQYKDEYGSIDTPLNLVRLYAHPHRRSDIKCSYLYSVLDHLSKGRPSVIQVVIGPEGGLTDAECDWLDQQGWQQIILGENILRVETAATMIAATWNAWQSHQSDD